MTDPKRMDVKIRFQPYPHHQLGQVLLYLERRGYDRIKEAEKLLISRFLPFALKEQSEQQDVDRQAATHIAHECMSQLSGAIQAIREIYQLQPPIPASTPNAEALSRAYECIGQLSGVIQSIQEIYQLQPPACAAKQILPGSLLSPGSGSALNGNDSKSVDHSELSEDPDGEELEPEQQRKTKRDPIQNDFLRMFGA
jgi:hypothetical protein